MSQATVERPVLVGQHVAIALPAGAAGPAPGALEAVLPPAASPGSGPGLREIALRETRSPAGLAIDVDLWSDTPVVDLDARLRSIPALAEAHIAVTPLEGRARETLGAWLRQDLFDLPADPARVEAARQLLQAELAARTRGTVNVHVDTSEPGRRRVKVEVTREAPQP